MNRGKGMRLEPKRSGHSPRINAERAPPPDLVAAAMGLAVVPPAEGNGELVAHLAPQSPALGKAQVMGV
ncbi:MAG TPA: hypothetical protein VEK55_18035 [Xanthobacteraceae bacterium]|nr:hypothetical protein [Xanthobacteraceae bacterium]